MTQFLIIRDQTTNFDNNRKKEIPAIQRFDKERCLADLAQIDWHNYLKIYKNDTDLSVELFLRKIDFLYNKYFPLITFKRKSKQDPSKPWLTPGIIAPPYPAPLPPVVKVGDWIFELQEIQGELKFFQNQGGKNAGDENSNKTKFQNEFKNVFMSYIINY